MLRKVYFAVAFLGLTFGTKAWAMECGAHSLPGVAQRLLTHRLPSWKIVELDDLHPDDKKLWSENDQDKCPGVIEGDFEIPHSYAVTLIQSAPGSLVQMLLLLEPSQNGYKLRTLNEASPRTFPDVLLKLPPGVYSDAEHTRTVNTKRDGVGYFHLEAGGIIYYATKHGFKSLVISE